MGKIVGVIPARGGSKGLPGKNTKLIRGKPMIAYVIEAAHAAKRLDRVIVSTDADYIADVAKEYGAEVIRRPDAISDDAAPIEESLRHIVRTLKENENIETDVTVLMQANVPIRPDGMIDDVIEKLLGSEYDSVVTVFNVNQRPQWMKRVVDGKIIPYMECKEFRRQNLEPLYLLDGAVMAVRVPVLFATEGTNGVHVYLGDNVGIYEQDRLYSTDVDSLEDFRLAEIAMEYLEKESSQ
ncbi:MAG: acylneuraminate cytidylyltransferase family protein [bacterium]